METRDTIGQGLRRVPWRWLGWGGIVGLLALPAVAMRFTDEVRWGPEDFVAMGIMLGTVGLGAELAVRLSRNLAYRLGFAVALGTGFLLLWSNLAVGFIGGDDDPANAGYLFVLLAPILGSVVSLFAARGMAWAMAVAAFGQVVVPVAAAIGGSVAARQPEVAVMTVVFAAMWGTSALLFRRAAREAAEPAGGG